MRPPRHPPAAPERRARPAPAYRAAIGRLDAALQQNTACDNSRKIALLRLALFGDVDRLQASGTIQIPQ